MDSLRYKEPPYPSRSIGRQTTTSNIVSASVYTNLLPPRRMHRSPPEPERAIVHAALEAGSMRLDQQCVENQRRSPYWAGMLSDLLYSCP